MKNFWLPMLPVGLLSLLMLLGVACAHRPSTETPSLFSRVSAQNPDSEQLVWVLPPQQGVQTQVRIFEKRAGQWQALTETPKAVVGKRGLASLGDKVEGDLKTPQGLFRLGTVYGKSAAFATKMPYEQLTEKHKWVDDPNSTQYNKLVRGPTSAGSYETLLRKDHLYDLVMVLEYNTEPIVPGKGSAIFMHLWEKPDAGTAGCVALDRPDLERLLGWLDPAKKPMILIGQ